MRWEQMLTGCLMVAWAVAEGGTAPSGLVREGNEAFEVGSYDEALKLYRKAAKERPDAPEIAYNQGAALYRKKDFAGAARHFTEAAQQAQDPGLAAKAEYNLGNCRLQEAEMARERDLKDSIQSTQQSVGHYREALRLDPTRKEAAENMEMAREYLKVLLEEQKQQPQSQQGQQDGEKNEDGQQEQQQPSESQAGQDPEKQGDQSQEQQPNQEGKEEEKKAAASKEEEKKEEAAAGKEQTKKEEEQAQMAEAKEDKDGEQKDAAAHEILEEEKENQERRRRVPVRAVKPVDKDW